MADIVVQVERFAIVEIDGQHRELPSSIYFAGIELDCDPTNQLIEAAHLQRQTNLGNLFGDLMISGPADLTRFDFYSAPFRIELTSKLRER